MSHPPSAQWWVINAAELEAALERANDGTTPWIVYAELIANSRVINRD